MDILKKIIEVKRKKLELLKKETPLSRMIEEAMVHREKAAPHRFLHALNGNDLNVIAEFKRRSPSKGSICADVAAADMARLYERGGASAISVLTEEDHFGGTLQDLRSIKETVSLPILRKDFIVDEYQVFESAVAGADALLLIVAALDDLTLAHLREVAENRLGMDALVEVHSEEEMERASASGAGLIGINNRDLKTFSVSLETSTKLVDRAPQNATLVSESGLSTRSDILRLKDLGFRGFLIGESLMTSHQPDQMLRELLGR